MIVADTNLIVYLFITGDQSTSAQKALEKDPYWITPPLWKSEFRNVLAGYMRRGMTLKQAQQTMTDALSIMENRQVEPSSEKILELLANSKCTAYDCEFIALAYQIDVPLVTADKQLLAQFPDIAISLEKFVE
jgi:predicted nucleic acid-binding protein